MEDTNPPIPPEVKTEKFPEEEWKLHMAVRPEQCTGKCKIVSTCVIKHCFTCGWDDY